MDKLVIEAYRRLGSVKAVAQYLGVSVVKVRRILITAGLWRSERSDAILDLLHEGFSSDEIATKLNVTRKAVEAYMPYTQGSYGGFERSYAAFESDLYRQGVFKASESFRHSRPNAKREGASNIYENR